MPTANVCFACAHWTKMGMSVFGKCRRFPPQFTRINAPHSQNVDGESNWNFPVTRDSNCCGEFKAKHTSYEKMLREVFQK